MKSFLSIPHFADCVRRGCALRMPPYLAREYASPAAAVAEAKAILAVTEARTGTEEYLPVSWIGVSIFTGQTLPEAIDAHGSLLDKAGLALAESLARFIVEPIQ